VSSLTWQAARYVRPDTKKGDNMDRTNYVEVKCIASEDPRDRFVFFNLKLGICPCVATESI
jgi:hypothetical protein